MMSPLVALDVFQVLDEQRLCAVISPGFQCRITGTSLRKQVIDQVLLVDVERDHTDAFCLCTCGLKPPDEFSYNRFCFGPVLPRFAAVETAFNRNKG
jgi:hypothetical protein